MTDTPHPAAPAPTDRGQLLSRGLRLEYLTVGWNLLEGAIAVAAALAAGSVALLGFGIDSFVECASGAVLIWRLLAERRATDPEAIEALEHRAGRLVGASLALLASYVAIDATRSLWQQDHPAASPVGVTITAVSIAVMWWLARAKRRTAAALGSSSLRADAAQTTACWWLSIVVLGGIGLNALAGWWWADPLAALAISGLLVREAVEAWRGEPCDD